MTQAFRLVKYLSIVYLFTAQAYGQPVIALSPPFESQTQKHTTDINVTNFPAPQKYLPTSPVAAFNSQDNEYLMAWTEYPEVPGQSSYYVSDIYAQRINALNGERIGVKFLLSDRRDTTPGLKASSHPALQYLPGVNQYLLVFRASYDLDPKVPNEFIYGAYYDAGTLERIGSSFVIGGDLRGKLPPPANPTTLVGGRVTRPDVSCKSPSDCLVVYENTVYHYTGRSPNANTFIAGQKISGTSQVGTDDFFIATGGGSNGAEINASNVRVKYNPVDDNYIAIWHEQIIAPNMELGIDGHRQGQSIVAKVLNFNISGAFVDSSPIEIAPIQQVTGIPDLSYSPAGQNFLAVWASHSSIMGRFLKPSGQSMVLGDAFQISRGDRRPSSGPDIAFRHETNQFIVVWQGLNKNIYDVKGGGFIAYEVYYGSSLYGQLIEADGRLSGVPSFRISQKEPRIDLGAVGNRSFPNSDRSALATNRSDVFTAWVDRGGKYSATDTDQFYKIVTPHLENVPYPEENPTPVSTAGPGPNLQIDLAAKFKKGKPKAKGTKYTMTCISKGAIPAESFMMSLYNSPDKKIDLTDKMLKQSEGSPVKNKISVKIKNGKISKFLLGACIPGDFRREATMQDNVSAISLKKNKKK